MTDHAVLISTSEGAVGGVVSEPEGEARAALLLLGGYGRPARSGINSFWTRTARSLAELGLVVLRIDYSREGETLPIGQGQGGLVWKRDLDLRLLAEIAPWFRTRVSGVPHMLAGSCSGARLGIELVGSEPEAFAGAFLIVPYIKDLDSVEQRLNSDRGSEPEPVSVDPLVIGCMKAMLEHAPSWILVGERDSPDVQTLERLVGATPLDLEVEVVPNLALHLLDQPRLQQEVSSRLLARIARAVGTPAGAI